MRYLATILFLTALLAGRAPAADASADFDSANKLYAEGKYSEAADLYQKIAAGGAVSPELLFNLGNAEFKAGETGRAIAAYARAERLAPRDPDVRANLQFARNQLPGGDSVRADWCARLLGRLTLNEWAVGASVCLWVFFGLLALRELRPAWRGPLRQFTVLAGSAAAVLWLGTAALGFDRHLNPVAVVVNHDAMVRGGPLDDAQTAFTARDGAELTVLDVRDDWLQVGDGHQRIGWVKRDAVERL
jgi:tetratricopeptide (TPR) repeat protein